MTHLYAKAGIALSLLILICLPASALSGEITKRTALCQRAQKKCTAIFYLNPKEKIAILNRSFDKTWLKIEVQTNKVQGWVNSKDIQSTKPDALKQEIILDKLDNNQVFLDSSQNEQMSFFNQKKNTIENYDLNGKLIDTIKFRIPEKLITRPLNGFWNNNLLKLINKVKIEEQEFLELVDIDSKSNITFKTLLQLPENYNSNKIFSGFTQDHFVLLSKGIGLWGQNEVFGLINPDKLNFVVPNEERILHLLPKEIRKEINPITLKIFALDSLNQMYFTVFNNQSKKIMLLQISPSKNLEWHWKTRIDWPFAPEKKYNYKVASNGNHIFISVSKNDKFSDLFFFGVTGEQLYKTSTTFIRKMKIDINGNLWTLHNDKLLKWKPQMKKVTKVK